MKALWAGESVTHRGAFAVDEAKLYTLPAAPPLLLGAALTPETARFIGGFTDGLITAAGKKTEDIRRVIDAFRDGGGAAKPVYLQVALSVGDTEEQALSSVHDQWRVAALNPSDLSDLKTPADFDQACASVERKVLKERLRISADWRRHLDWLRADLELGIDAIYLNYVGQDVERFIDLFGERVLPECALASASEVQSRYTSSTLSQSKGA